jgi:hypothetical protein
MFPQEIYLGAVVSPAIRHRPSDAEATPRNSPASHPGRDDWTPACCFSSKSAAKCSSVGKDNPIAEHPMASRYDATTAILRELSI